MEIKQSYSDVKVDWEEEVVLAAEQSNPTPVRVMANCECGNQWRLRRLSSLAELKTKFNLT